MKFCSDCGGPVRRAVPPGDSLDRYICDACERVFYTNPNMIVGTLPRWGNRILLCKRSIEPRLGYWTLPSGFLENDETTEEGALRETLEEAGVEVDLGPLFSAVLVAVSIPLAAAVLFFVWVYLSIGLGFLI